MGAAALIAMIFGSFVLLPMLSDQTNVAEDDDGDVPVDPVDPVDPATLGATFESTDDGINIQFGENETGRLAVFTYVDTEDDDPFLAIHEARYYLVPEGTEWPDNTSETASRIPGQPVDELPFSLADFEDHFGMTLLGTYDLLANGDDTPTNRDMADSLPPLTTNADVEHYYIESNTDGDDLIFFLQEGWLETRNGIETTHVTEDTVGTDDFDWITAQADGIMIEGAGGDDALEGDQDNVSFYGGDGDDYIRSYGADVIIDGGAGNDEIWAVHPSVTTDFIGEDKITSSTITGGDGDDRISASEATVDAGAGDDSVRLYGSGVAVGGDGDDYLSNTREISTLYGGQGDDSLIGRGDGTELFGGDGADFVSADTGVTGYGGSGSDYLQIYGGGVGFGGDGTDYIAMWDFLDNDNGPLIASGGAGADTFDVASRVFSKTVENGIFAQIEDFDPDEDVLLVGTQNSDGLAAREIRIIDDPDGAYSDVEVDFGRPNGVDRIMTIRIMGETGITAEHVMLR